jgi:hypothetical protein
MPDPQPISLAPPRPKFAFSVCTLVNDAAQYEAMLASFRRCGFQGEECEYLYADNRGENRFDAFAAISMFLERAAGEFVILCHQDVRLVGPGLPELLDRLEALERKDPRWAVCGNAAGLAPGVLAVLTGDSSRTQRPVDNLDESFLVVKRAAGLRPSADLFGFHFYGADLCLVADFLGHTAYVVDFPLLHLSPGVRGLDFYRARARFIAKYRRALRGRMVTTTCTTLFLGRKASPRALVNIPILAKTLQALGRLAPALSLRLFRARAPSRGL